MNRELIKIDISVNALVERKVIDNLLEINSYTQQHGLVMTETIAKEIAEARQAALRDYGRVDFSSDTTARLVKAFSQSYYITQETFSEIIGEIIELFYFIKNELGNTLSDDDLISEMLIVFNETCFGTVEVMQSKGVEKIIRKHKLGDTKIWDDYEKDRIVFGVDDVWHDYESLEDKLKYGENWRE